MAEPSKVSTVNSRTCSVGREAQYRIPQTFSLTGKLAAARFALMGGQDVRAPYQLHRFGISKTNRTFDHKNRLLEKERALKDPGRVHTYD